MKLTLQELIILTDSYFLNVKFPFIFIMFLHGENLVRFITSMGRDSALELLKKVKLDSLNRTESDIFSDKCPKFPVKEYEHTIILIIPNDDKIGYAATASFPTKENFIKTIEGLIKNIESDNKSMVTEDIIKLLNERN